MKGGSKLDFSQIQEMLLTLLPLWNYRIAKPFKQLLDEGISLEMYYCIRTLQWGNGIMTMSELARYTKMQKQQMTQMVNRLVEQNLVERIYEPSNRRIIKIRITNKAAEYIEHFLEHDAVCFRPLLEEMTPQDLSNFKKGLELLIGVFSNMTCCQNESDIISSMKENSALYD